MWKCYIKNNYIFFENLDISHRHHKTDVIVEKESKQSNIYFLRTYDTTFLIADLKNLVDQNETPFTKETFDEFITLNTGC